ncbi:MAG: type II CAAX prenyl endopeptidase Rce1 family protein [Candidatus Hodarchaeota archaeon]
MRKFHIAEIENSYLNFFTPAVIVAIGFFLINLFDFPITLFHWFNSFLDLNLDHNILNVAFANISMLLICLIAYYVLIPRLKLEDPIYQEPDLENFAIVPLFLCVVIFLRVVLTFVFESYGVVIYDVPPWFLSYNYYPLFDDSFLILFLIFELITIPLFTESVYRRVIIPLLEDRGLSPIFAVILSSLAFCLLDLPYYISTTNYLGTLYWFISTFFYGFATGMIYIYTRNILFSVLYASVYHFYRMSDFLGRILQNELLILIRDSIHLLTFLGSIIVVVYIVWITIRDVPTNGWIRFLKTIRIESAPNIKRGIIGYFLISVSLVVIQMLATDLISQLTWNNELGHLLLNSLFYLIAFSIPFWLSVTTEYVQN